MADSHQHPALTSSFRLLIVEDELVIKNRLERLFTELLRVQNIQPDITTADSLPAAKLALRHHRYHLISLDLNLKGESGFELLQQACCSASQSIIISAYRDQAVTAFEYGVLDFIAKPFSRQRLNKALLRLLAQDKAVTANSTKYLLVKNGRYILRLLTHDIESISGYGNYTQLNLQNAQQYLHEMGLDRLLKILPDNFLRVHKSHILNLNTFSGLSSLGGGQYQVKTLSGTLIPVGRTRVQELKERIGNGLFTR